MMQRLLKKSHPLISKGLKISAILILVSLAVAVTHFIDAYYTHALRGSDPTIHSGPWGDLQEWDIRVEQAMEFVNFDRTSNEGPFWNFGSLTAPAVQLQRRAVRRGPPQERQAAQLLDGQCAASRRQA